MKRAKAKPTPIIGHRQRPLSVKPPLAVELRKLGEDMRVLLEAAPCFANAAPTVSNCISRLCAEARVIEANAQLDKARGALEKIVATKDTEGFHTRQARMLQWMAAEGLK